jgi:hypothetical protein
MRQYLLLGVVSLLVRCEPSAPCQRRAIPLYVMNDSVIDTLAQAHIKLNDSLLVHQRFATHLSSSDKLFNIFKVCPDKQKIQVKFGRYERDTLLTITGNQSLLVSMNYDSIRGLEVNNGITIVLVDHDAEWRNRRD